MLNGNSNRTHSFVWKATPLLFWILIGRHLWYDALICILCKITLLCGQLSGDDCSRGVEHCVYFWQVHPLNRQLFCSLIGVQCHKKIKYNLIISWITLQSFCCLGMFIYPVQTQHVHNNHNTNYNKNCWKEVNILCLNFTAGS